MKIRLECEDNNQVQELDVHDSMSLAELKMLACVQFFGDDSNNYELTFQGNPIGVGDMASTTLLQNNIPDNCLIKLRNKQTIKRDQSPSKKRNKPTNQGHVETILLILAY